MFTCEKCGLVISEEVHDLIQGHHIACELDHEGKADLCSKCILDMYEQSKNYKLFRENSEHRAKKAEDNLQYYTFVYQKMIEELIGEEVRTISCDENCIDDCFMCLWKWYKGGNK